MVSRVYDEEKLDDDKPIKTAQPDKSLDSDALDIANAEPPAPETETDTDAESTDGGPKSTFKYNNDTKNKKKKIALLVGSGGGFLMIGVLVIFMANMLKIPNLAQHIAEYNMFSVARTFNKSAQQSLNEKLAVDAKEIVFSETLKSRVGAGYQTFRGNTWGKLDKYRPNQVIKNLGSEDKLKYIYEEKPRTLFPGTKQILTGIEINGKAINMPETSFGHIFSNTTNKINFSSDLDAAVAAAYPEAGFITRSKVVKKLRNAMGIKLNFWQKAGASYKKLKDASEAFKQQQLEERSRVKTTATEGCAVPQTCSSAAAANKELDKTLESEAKSLETDLNATKAAAKGELTVAEQEAQSATLQSILSSTKTSMGLDILRSLGGVYAIALPFCIIYDGSIVKAQPVIDAKDAALQKTYYGLMTAADQQKSGQTNAVAVGAMNNKLGDISQSLPEQRAYGRKVSTKDYVPEPDQPQNGGIAEDMSLADLLPAALSNIIEPGLDDICPVLLDAKIAAAMVVLQLALAAVSIGSGTAAEEAAVVSVTKAAASLTDEATALAAKEMIAEFLAQTGVEVTATQVVEEATVRVAAREAAETVATNTGTTFLSKVIKRKTLDKFKSLGFKLGRDTILIGGTTLLSKMLVLAHMGGNTTGLETDSSYANRADMGGNLVGNDIHRKTLMGRPLDEVEQIASRAEDQKDLAMITSRESGWNRYLAIGNAHSLISKMGFGMLNHFGGSNTARFSAIRNIFSLGFVRNSWGFIQNMTPGRGIVLAAATQTDNYGIVQWGWTKEELDISANDPSYGVIINDEIYNRRSDKQAIEDEYSKCFTESMGKLLAYSDVVKKDGKIKTDEGTCTPTNLGIKNPTYGDGVFRYRLSVKNNNVLDHLLDVQNVVENDSPLATGANNE